MTFAVNIHCRAPLDAAKPSDACVAGVILIRQRRNIDDSMIIELES